MQLLHRLRFVSLWLLLTLLLAAILSFALFLQPAAAQDAPEADAIDTPLNQMESAVGHGEREAYLALGDLSDPVFAVEHRH